MTAPLIVLAIATPFVKSFEGFVPTPQDDGLGNLTIGYGMIASDFPGGRMPQHMSEHEAAILLSKKLSDVYYVPVAELMRSARLSLNPNQQAALLSFVFNLGTGEISAGHDIGRLLRAHELRAAADSMLEYSDPGNPNVHAGLLRRRLAERALFLTRWVDPDPHKYAWYDTVEREIAPGRRASEQETVREYDRKRAHWFRFPGRLRRLRQNCQWFVKRLDYELVANHKHDPRGTKFHRQWRRNHLKGRADGRRYV